MKIRVSKSTALFSLFLICGFFLYMPPLIISVDPNFDIWNKAVRVGATFISLLQILLYIVNIKKNRNFYPMIVALLFIIMEVSNFKNGYSVNRTLAFLMNAITIVGLVCMLVNFSVKGKLDILLNSFILYSSVISLWNLWTQIFHYRNGLYHNFKYSWQPYYLCGNANSFVFFYTITLAVLYAQADRLERYEWKLYGYFVNVCMIYSAFLGKTTTGTVCVLLFLILNLLADLKFIKIVANHSVVIFLTVLGLVVWFIVFRGWDAEYVKDIVANIVHEKRNLLTRGEIWDFAIRRIKKQPIWGYGSINPYLSFCASEGTRRSAHNTYLQITLYGGIYAIVVYFLILFMAIRRVTSSYVKGRIQYILAFFIYLLSYIFEQNPFYIGFYMLLALMYVQSRITDANIAWRKESVA